jgi:hypothetical protein
MSEVFEHNPGDHEDPLTGPTWIVGFLGAVLLTVITLGLTALFYNAQSQEEQHKVVSRDPMELQNLQAVQHEQISGEPRWVVQDVRVEGSEQPQRVRTLVIPIEQAKQLVVNEQSRGGQRQPQN